MIWPPPVAPGDCIAVVAPSSPFGAERFDQGIAWLRQRYRVKAGADILARAGYLAGSDARRAAELSGAMLDPEVKAIVAARGGYGAMRIADELPWDAFAASPKWLVGFSDVTALHACAWARGVASIHAPNVTGLGQDGGLAAEEEAAAWLRAIEQPQEPQAWKGLRVLHPGRREGGENSAAGPLLGGNMSLVHAIAASGKLVLPEGCVLALEDVTERPYRIDRMLTSLRSGGYLRRASAIVFGSFAQCEPGIDGVTVDEVLAVATGDLGVPVLTGAPFGHASPNDAFVLGAVAVVTAGEAGVVRIGRPTDEALPGPAP